MSSFLRSRSASARSLVLQHGQHAVQHVLDDVADAHAPRARRWRSRASACRARTDRGGAAWRDRRRRGLAGSSRSATRAIFSVQKMKSSDSATLKTRWNSTTSRAGSSSSAGDPAVDVRAANGMASTQPISLNRKLPSVTRRASGGECSVDSMPSKAAAEVGAEHEAERDRQRDHVQRRERGDQQHDGEARVAQDREQRGDQHVEQHVAGQRREDHLDAGGLHDRLGGDRDPLQREHDEAEPDQDAAEAADVGRLPARGTASTPTKISSGASQDRSNDRIDGDERRADVGAQHHGQRRRGADEALAGERGDDQRGRRAALDEAGDAEAGEERGEALADALAQDAPQVAAVQAQDAGAHDVRAPDEQRDAGEQVEQVCTYRSRVTTAAKRVTTAASTSSCW